MVEYKKNYSEAELKELFKWFETNEYDNQVDIGHGQNVFDVKRCSDSMIYQISTHPGNPTYSGMAHKLFIIREELIKQGKVRNKD